MVINPRRACAARVTVVACVCVCLSVKQHLTSGASVRPESDTTYSADNEGEKNCSVLPETAPLQRSSTFYIGIYRAVRHFLRVALCARNPHRRLCT